MSDANNETMPNDVAWYCSIDGQRLGPVDHAEIVRLIALNKITERSMLWNKAMVDWQPVLSTSFANLVQGPSVPPPLTGTAVNNTFVWFLALAPLIGTFLESFISELTGFSVSGLWWITVVLNIALSYEDDRRLVAAGHDTASMGSFFLVPVYLYKRAQILNHSLAYFIVWCVTFGLILTGAV